MLVRDRENADSRSPEGVSGKVEEAVSTSQHSLCGEGSTVLRLVPATKYKWKELSLLLVPG